MRSACESLVAVLCYTSMYTVRAVPVPAPLRALTAGFQSTRLSFMAEPVFQLREWLSHLDLQVRVCNCVHGAAGFSSMMNVCVCVCLCDSWCCLARFILDAAGVHCYVRTHILHHCERQAVFNGVTV
jgi:hypothetical protein